MYDLSLPVSGRSLGQTRAVGRPVEGGAIIRVESETFPEFWMEVRVSRAALVELLALVDALELPELPPVPPFELPDLADLAELLPDLPPIPPGVIG